MNRARLLAGRLYCGARNLACYVPGLVREGQYALPWCYRHREHAQHFDATVPHGEWQEEVYRAAAAIAERHGYRTIFDVGCGDGAKLLRHFASFDTVGFEVEPALGFLKTKWPERRWGHAVDDIGSFGTAKLVICADVIEHVADPLALIATLKSLATGHIVLSTPDRRLMARITQSIWFGPPLNPSHYREWTYGEFRRFVGRHLAIERHEISNREQGTQIIVARAAASPASVRVR